MSRTLTAERAEDALRAGRLGVWEWNIADDSIYWSQQCFEIVGLSPDRFHGVLADFLDCVHADDRPSMWAEVQRALDGGEQFSARFRVHCGEQIRWVSNRGVVKRDDSGRPVQLIGIVRDETDDVWKEAQLHGAVAQAREANETKDRFLATVSHELRNPLNAVLGYARILRAGQISEERIHHIAEIIEVNAQLQLRLVDDLLDASRLLAGKLRMRGEPVTTADFLLPAFEAVRPDAHVKGVTLMWRAGPAVALVADAMRLQQVLANVLTNAIKFTPAGGTVTLSSAVNAGMLEIEVRDTGVGVDAKFIDRAFEHFSQDQQSSGGLGLGLAIAKSIVDAHAGQISLRSDGHGHGATVRIQLPISGGGSSARHDVSTLGPTASLGN
jgi:signal transduction histidine kinase